MTMQCTTSHIVHVINTCPDAVMTDHQRLAARTHLPGCRTANCTHYDGTINRASAASIGHTFTASNLEDYTPVFSGITAG